MIVPALCEAKGLTAGNGMPGIGLGDLPRFDAVSVNEDLRDGVIAGGRIGSAELVGVPGALGDGDAIADPSGR